MFDFSLRMREFRIAGVYCPAFYPKLVSILILQSTLFIENLNNFAKIFVV
ncbi:hypothetical protein [Helicobacter bilis]|nr:hypothetical protein [Helicobacter bilis]